MPILKDQQSLKIHGTSEAKWDGDGWFIVRRGVMDMEHLGKSQGLEAWTYEIHEKKYRSTWVDRTGMIGMGEGTYDEKADTWHMKATSYGPRGNSSFKGWGKFTDADTMEWWFAEYQCLMKIMKMSGTSKRVK